MYCNIAAAVRRFSRLEILFSIRIGMKENSLPFRIQRIKLIAIRSETILLEKLFSIMETEAASPPTCMTVFFHVLRSVLDDVVNIYVF